MVKVVLLYARTPLLLNYLYGLSLKMVKRSQLRSTYHLLLLKKRFRSRLESAALPIGNEPFYFCWQEKLMFFSRRGGIWHFLRNLMRIPLGNRWLRLMCIFFQITIVRTPLQAAACIFLPHFSLRVIIKSGYYYRQFMH